MKIAQIAPLFESVPPKLYGGTERVVAFLTEELVRMGHEVTLFATADSNTSARLIPCRATGSRLDAACEDQIVSHVLMMERFAQVAHEFDVAHFHVDYFHFSLMRRLDVPHVTTLHGRLDISDLQPLYDEFREVPVVSISDYQRRPLPQANWQATVHHGLPLSLHGPGPERRTHVTFLGRISPEKNVDGAIRIARAAEMPLVIAAKYDHGYRPYRDYFESRVQPLLSAPGVTYIGEVNESEKERLLRESTALIFPIEWPEPFGLVMLEAMACGTPVVAYGRGSVPEVIEDGVTGFIVENEAEAAAALRRAGELDPAAIRREFERRFGVRRMAEDYVSIYQRLRGGRLDVGAPASDAGLEPLVQSAAL